MPNLVELLEKISNLHRAETGIWCIPVENENGKRFLINDRAREVECLTCSRVWCFQ